MQDIPFSVKNTRKNRPTPTTTMNALSKSGRALGAEDLLVADLGDTVGEREGEVLGDELLDVGALDVIGLLDLNNAEDVDRPEAGTVAGSHVGVKSLDSGGAGQLTVLLVHVVSAGAGVVADPDAEVLDLQGVLLGDGIDADDLASGLLDLTQAAKEVPEAGLGDNLVRRKDAHAVEAGSRVGLRGQMAPNDLVLLEAT